MTDGDVLSEAMLEAASESIIARDAYGRILAWNRAATRLYGYAKGEALGAEADWLLKSEPAFALDEDSRYAGGGVPVTRRTADGRALCVNAHFHVIRKSDGSIRQVIETSTSLGRDCSHMRMSEHYRALFLHMPIGLCIVNGDGLYDYYRSIGLDTLADVEIAVRDRPEILKKVGEIVFIEEINPRGVELLGANDADELLGRSIGFAWALRPDTFRRSIMAGISQTSMEEETQVAGRDGLARDILFSCTTLRDGTGRRGMVGMIDINDRLRAEADFFRMRKNYAHASRLSFLGEIFAAVAHEISQPVAAIATDGESGLRWLDRVDPELDSARTALTRIKRHAMRARDVIERVRHMMPAGQTLSEDTDLPTIVGDVLRIVESHARSKRALLHLRNRTSNHRIHVDPTQIEQVLVNILTNAIEAVVENKSPNRDIDVELTDGTGTVVCTIMDSGTGVAGGKLERIFDMSIDDIEGLEGLGLQHCRKILRNYDGRISVENGSSLGGASVRFEIPAVFG